MRTTIYARILLAALCCLLALATSASAEFAWVLWSHVETSWEHRAATEEWIAAGVPTAKDCYSSMKDTIKMQGKSASNNEAVTVNGNIIFRSTPELSTRTFTYTCLPDTVDPRGPKR